METPIKMDDLGVPPFKETPIDRKMQPLGSLSHKSLGCLFDSNHFLHKFLDYNF